MCWRCCLANPVKLGKVAGNERFCLIPSGKSRNFIKFENTSISNQVHWYRYLVLLFRIVLFFKFYFPCLTASICFSFLLMAFDIYWLCLYFCRKHISLPTLFSPAQLNWWQVCCESGCKVLCQPLIHSAQHTHIMILRLFRLHVQDMPHEALLFSESVLEISQAAFCFWWEQKHFPTEKTPGTLIIFSSFVSPYLSTCHRAHSKNWNKQNKTENKKLMGSLVQYGSIVQVISFPNLFYFYVN